ncbi:hypothetical protein [Deinococcus sp.]|uniref:hypothetical protein n=1 Tax=Deinococcus sp. TaxID=47478 RepID=UPI0025C1A7AB|nr:hypothetical protein [Deinococcus sp.]
MLFSIVPSFVATSSGNQEDFKIIYFKAVYSVPIGFILGTAITYLLSLSEHPDLTWHELNLFTVWFSKFPIIASVVFVAGLVSQFIYCFSKIRPSLNTPTLSSKEQNP